MDELVAVATQQLNRIKLVLNQAGVKYVDLGGQLFGVGAAVGFGPNDFVVLAVMGGGMENQLLITSGILNNIRQDRLPALEVCNRFNQSNTAYPVFLHDAEKGWAILTQQTLPIELLLDAPAHLVGVVRALPQVAKNYRESLTEKAALGGEPWSWNDEELGQLLIRSMM